MEKKEYKVMFWILFTFGLFYFIPYQSKWFETSVIGGINLLNEYAKEHVLTCLIPALFIAGSIGVFIKKDAVLKLLGAKTKKYISYSTASVSGAILAVCSCTILPIFAGIRSRGAGLGPAITFLFSGPAINIAAIFLTMSVLGYDIGFARVISAILIAIIVGLTMAFLFKEKITQGGLLIAEEKKVNLSKAVLGIFFFLLIGILIVNGLQISSFIKYMLMGLLVIFIILITVFKFSKDLTKSWLEETWSFAKLILPMLFIGVFIAGFIMPLIPEELITNLVGKNTVLSNLTAAIFGAFMYFSTLTEVPILQALIAKGMHSGPALALLLAGPSLSLPNMLVVRNILGNKKTFVYVLLVVFYSTIAGFIFGYIL
ncbi:MAG: permease [Nanoarchaeota archaeon]